MFEKYIFDKLMLIPKIKHNIIQGLFFIISALSIIFTDLLKILLKSFALLSSVLW